MQPATIVISVSELNRKVRLAIEKSIPSCWVTGEISNLTRASSGHWYFTLKDTNSSVKCVFFRNRSQFIDWSPVEGDQVEVRAQATLYEPRGDYQIVIDAMRKSGIGDLFAKLLRLKSRLEEEGLFDTAIKSQPPEYPKQLGVVTSLHGAALQDVLKTLQNRWPLCPIVIYPASVQGNEAVFELRKALEAARERNECDVILLTRGGGSFEDMQAFNDEALVRTLAASKIPFIAAIGHETDFSLAEFAASVRAATPTAAAQRAVPDRAEVEQNIAAFQDRLDKSLIHVLQLGMQRLDSASKRVSHPGKRIHTNSNLVDQIKRRILKHILQSIKEGEQKTAYLTSRLIGSTPDYRSKLNLLHNHQRSLGMAITSRLIQNKNQIELLFSSLQQSNPERLLARGYCIALREDGAMIRTINGISAGSKVLLQMTDGKVETVVHQTIQK